MTRSRLRSGLASAALVVGVFGLSACSIGSADVTGTPSRPADGPAGPWAQEFADALADHPSSFERSVLEDGSVTESELAEAHSKMRRCMAESRMTINWLRDGGFEVGDEDGGAPPNGPDRTDDLLRACETKWDNSITYLFETTRRNPQRQDEAKLVVGCLRKAGAVDRSYSEQAWRREDADGVYSFDEHSAEAVQCRLDPLGLWRQQ